MKRLPDSTPIRAPWRLAAGALLLFSLACNPAKAADQTWNGAGGDGFWHNAANWGGTLPAAGDSLIFAGTVGLVNTNNYSVGTAFNGITFNGPGGFLLRGNEIQIAGNITNNQVVTLESVNIPLSLSVTPDVDVVENGSLALNGAISGSGGLTKTGEGLLKLGSANTFAGDLMVKGGTVMVEADENLGGGNLTLDGGTLATTSSFELSASREVTVGPGQGGIDVSPESTLTYGGVIGGSGGLTKSGYGTLVLSGANSYSGPTTNAIGFMTLDFSGTTSDIINSASSVTLGGGNASGAASGGENEARLTLAGGSDADTQSFTGVHSTFGGSSLIATNGNGGTMNVSLGELSHDPGGTLYFVTPEASGGGHVTTTSTNLNGILGGWALISGDANSPTIYHEGGNTGGNHNNGVAHDLVMGTNFAAVDASGNIVNFTGFSNVTASAGTIASQVAGAAEPPNVAIDDSASSTVVNVDTDNAGTTTDINAIRWTTYSSGFDSISIGTGNTLRLGRYGAIIRNGPSTGNAVYIGGPNSTAQSGSGTSGYGDIGTLTAGGADNTPGEIIIVANNPNESSGTTILEPTIADNGTGPVTVVKMGPGSIKLDGHNTFSGGLYLLQGRVQWAGAEIGNANPDGGGTGPIYVLPGSYIFPTGTGGAAITNAFFVAGGGDAKEAFGVFRGGTYTGPITLIGDTTIGCDANDIEGSISGDFNLTFGGLARNGTVTLGGTNNNWTGNTILSGGGTSSPHNTVINNSDEVIPNGFGYGNVIMDVGNAGGITWNLNGFNETINGLSTSGNASDANAVIQNGGATAATLTIGDNNQSGVFGGSLQDGSASLALTKTGGGVETLTGNSTYTGPTVVNGGTLALTGAGLISSSLSVQVDNGASLDVSGVAGGFSFYNPIGLNGGTLIGDSSDTGLSFLNLTNAALTLSVDPAKTNLVVSALDVSGSDVINISSVFNVPSYPAQFTLIKYSGLTGAAANFSLGSVPTPTTLGYISNDVANSSIVLVLTAGPKALTWAGTPANNDWDVASTANWDFSGSAVEFNNLDSVVFDQTASTTSVNLATVVLPSAVTVNGSKDYTFTGDGAISGSAFLTKNGSGTLNLFESGGDTFNGGVTVNEGGIVFGSDNFISGGLVIADSATAQVGTNGDTGNLPAGNVVNNGTLDFNRSKDVSVNNSISGMGTLNKMGANVLTLSGGNGSFTGAVNVAEGVLKAGSGSALGAGTNTISSGATLDVNGQQLNNVPVIVSGAGVNGDGAIINSGANSQNALGSVTLTDDTTFGGTGRWDIRGGTATLATDPTGSAYNLTKVGPNFVGLVNLTVDSGLGNVDIKEGTLDYEGSTSGLGDSSKTLTVESGATLMLYNSSVALSKSIVLNGTGTNSTLICGNNTANAISGTVQLNGDCVFEAANNALLTFDGALSGSGSFTKIGGGSYDIGSGMTASYTGGTVVSNGTLLVDGNLSGAVTVNPGGTLGGSGTAGGAVSLIGGNIAPGSPLLPQATFKVGSLVLSNASGTFELSTSTSFGNDQVAVTGGLTVDGTNTITIVPPATLSKGDVYTLFTYGSGSLDDSVTNQIVVTSSRVGFTFSVVAPSTTPGSLSVRVDTAIGSDTWTGTASADWDTATTNWTRNSNPATFNDHDFVTFDDTSTRTNVNLTKMLDVSGITMNNFTYAYTFAGSGSLTGVGGLHLAGNPPVIFANQGTNDFSGPISIDYGVLQVGNGGTNGNLGTGTITNNGVLLLDRSGEVELDNAITGIGSITNIGDGVATLGGSSGSFDGNIVVQTGTLRTANNAALGDTTGTTTINNGATLDVGQNDVHLGAEPLYASGGGVGGEGAIVNNSGDTGYGGNAGNFNNLTMLGDTTIGGSGRMDMRNDSTTPTLSTGGSPFKLTKVGDNGFHMVDVTVDGALGNVDVKGGLFGLQGNMSLGEPTSNITVYADATLDFYSFANPFDKVTVLEDGSTVSVSHSPDVTFVGPVTLDGTGTFDAHSASFILSNTVSGGGSLRKAGSHDLTLTGTQSYTGDTIVSGGKLVLVGNSLPASPVIDVASGTLDLSQAASTTLTLASGQTLQGGGTVDGTLVAGSGSTVAPGDSVGTLTITGDATLNGATVIELDGDAGNGDQLKSANVTYGGTLTVTNINGTLASGQSFQLFSAGTYNGSFATVNLPQLPTGLSWQNTLATDGTISIIGSVQTGPSFGTVGFSNGTLSFSGSGGVANGTYYVLATTNVALPIGQWTPVATNSFDQNGDFTFSTSMDPNEPELFYSLQVGQ